ncbi:MAG: DUF1467 family protein [Alphaproteobacteria bacterium]|nr:DUF1467 family protein [Alphaproteobacteria bacterium]
MGIVTGIIVFLLIWWTSLFMVLPFGHKREGDGTPVKPNMKKKLLWTTLLAVILWGIVFSLIEADIVSFREIADHMIEEDYTE